MNTGKSIINDMNKNKFNKLKKYILRFKIRFKNAIILIFCALIIGIVTGVADALFGSVLINIGNFRDNNIFWLLPFLVPAGFLIVFIYSRFGKDSNKGMSLLFEKAQGKRKDIPLRLIPIVTVSTWLTHLFGGSAGREGVAVQIGGTIGNFISRKIKIKNSGNILMITGMASGFGGLFRTPVAATFFAMEILSAGKIEISALLPSFVGAFTASCISGLFALEKFEVSFSVEFKTDINFIVCFCFAGIIFGVIGGLFAFLLEKTKKLFSRTIKNPYIKITVIGAAISILSFICFKGRYSGLGTNIISAAFSGGEIFWFDFAAKFIFTIITLSGGFQGGEVTPLFAIGAALGTVIGYIFGMPPILFAAIGYSAVFGAATNTFIAPAFIGAEVFGYEYMPYFVVTCMIAYIFNGNNCIYQMQKR